MRGYVLLLTLAVSLAYLQYSNACSCMRTHPQTQFCKADFVILARVKRDKTYKDQRFYKVRVRKSYKMSEKASVALKSGRLLTAKDDAMCGIDLEVGKLYAISGHIHSLKAYINLCGMAIKWKNLTRRQRKGLRSMYKHGCSCGIDYCKYRGCRNSSESCPWDNDCQFKEGICLRSASKKCMWTRNRALSSCLKDQPLTISRWSG